MSTGRVIPLIINGQDVQSQTTFETISPLTGKVSNICSSASPKHVEAAIETAQAAFPTWSRTKYADRRDLLLHAAEIMTKRKAELGEYMHEEIGANHSYQHFIIGLAIDGLKDVAGRIAGACQGHVPESIYEGMRAMVLKRPYGVCLGIAPW